MTAAIEIKNVSKLFADHTAVRNVSMTIEEGEFFSLLGPSGCGKTTLLRMIAGFEFPTEGSIAIGGVDMSQIPPHKRPVNMVFQSYALFPHLTVADNIAFGLRAKKLCSEDQIKVKVKEALELVRLPQLGNRYPRELSGGQQQRVAFARAIVNKPSVLLLDEPLSALDPKIRQEMQMELARFKEELKITFVMVTHDQAEALALSSRIAVLSAGNLEQVGQAREIYVNPASEFVADFIGQTNILRGQVLAIEEGDYLVRLSDNIDVWATAGENAGDLKEGDKVIFWVRQSDMHLTDLRPAPKEDKANAFSVHLKRRSYQGATYDYHVALSEQVQLTVSCDDSICFEPGEAKLTLTIPKGTARVLPDKKA